MDLPMPSQVWNYVVNSYDDLTGSVDKGRAADTIYPDLSKAFSMVSHSILISRPVRCGLQAG